MHVACSNTVLPIMRFLENYGNPCKEYITKYVEIKGIQPSNAFRDQIRAIAKNPLKLGTKTLEYEIPVTSTFLGLINEKAIVLFNRVYTVSVKL